MIQYIKDYFFTPSLVDGKPRKSDKHYRNIFTYKGEMASKEREIFFNEAYGEILFDLFLQWVKSPVGEAEEREHLYRQALALGSVKEKLIGYEMFGKNAALLQVEDDEEEEDND